MGCQLSKVADLDVFFFAVGERNDQCSFGQHVVHQDVKNLLNDSIKRISYACQQHRQSNQSQLRSALSQLSKLTQSNPLMKQITQVGCFVVCRLACWW